MKIPRLKPDWDKPLCEVVLWDMASTCQYVQNSHSRKMGFPVRRVAMRVCTLGANIKMTDGVMHKCQAVDHEGNVE